MHPPGHRHSTFAIITAWIVGVALIGSGIYAYVLLRQENVALREEIASLTSTLELTSANLLLARNESADLAQNLEGVRATNDMLSQTLQSEQTKNSVFESQIRDISGAVGTLTKLSQTDPELLKKYSKVYFLSENYVPAKLSPIDSQYLSESARAQEFNAEALPFLDRMLFEAGGSGIPLKIVSAYRSFSDQISVKTGYKFVYGSGANAFSADQGYSEHQLGTAVDLATEKFDDLSLQFEKDPAYAWLTNNAYRFGFVLSYPKSNAYYQFEPWHWRFVGVSLAKKLHAEHKNFYDLTQRDIDVYLITLFDEG